MISTQKPSVLGGNERPTAYLTQQGINRQAGVAAISSGPVPRGQPRGAIGISFGTSFFSVFEGQGSGPMVQRAILPNATTNYAYIDFQSGTGAPTTSNYPEDGDYGFYRDLATSYVYFVINDAGTITPQNIETLNGTITATQHGYQGAATASSMHSFVQITGTITAAQHGNFTAATANDSLHALATTQHNGFLSSSGFSLLAGATNASASDTLARRSSAGNANFKAVNLDASTGNLQVNGTKVVGAQETGVTGAGSFNITGTDTVNAASVSAWVNDVRTTVNAVIVRLRNHGLIESP